MARDVRRAVRAADPARVPGLVSLRDTGWQLVQLTGELTDMVALLAEHTAHHAEDAEHVHLVDGQLPRACRDLAALRRALDASHTAARDYYTAMSHVTHAPDPPRSSPSAAP
jgi:hypothetical protein